MKNISEAPEGLPSVSGIIGMFVLDSVLYLVLAWYFDNIYSGEFGVSKPFYFCFTPSYWGFGKSQWNNTIDTSPDDNMGFPLDKEETTNSKTPVMEINKLRKEFETTQGTYVAVKGLTMNLYDNEVISLLGKNGAGKTTLISMLTGLIPPTSGDAKILGQSITTDMPNIRKMLGVCPQHNIIWEKLSVRDHLIVYAGIKGTPLLKIKAMVDSMAEEIKLGEKSRQAAGTLSGGQKRRLCKFFIIFLFFVEYLYFYFIFNFFHDFSFFYFFYLLVI